MEKEATAEARRRVVELVRASSQVSVQPSVPLRRYYRSLNEMFRMGEVYLKEAELSKALQLFIRFTSLWLEAIPKHPNFASSQDGAVEKEKAKGRLLSALSHAEKLRGQLEKEYQQEALLRLQTEKAEREAAERRRLEEEAKRPPKPVPQPRHSLQSPVAELSPAPVEPEPASSLSPTDFPSLDSLSAPLPKSEPSAPPLPSATGGPPSVDRSTKPTADRSVKPEAAPRSEVLGECLRELSLPTSLVPRFAQLAEANTARNVETCGILGGRLEAGRFRVTCLVVPEQSGTSDSCTTSGEEELFAVMDSRELVTLGWIHTHPSQTAFLSSVDMHTQASYQLMLPEAVAVVYSPKFAETGIFHLTPPAGLAEIADCRQGGFHPHSQVPPCFQLAAHADPSQDLPLEIVDLRK